MVLTENYGIPLPKHIENEILQRIVVLLVTMNLTENLATHSYMQPLDGHSNVYIFNQQRQHSNIVTYYIGNYGACPAAIRDVLPRFETHDSTSAVVMMADQCFPNLGAIISVGVACGIKGKVKICDVLVSSKVINYDNEEMLYSSTGEIIRISDQLCRLFTHPIQWPSDLIKKCLNDNGEQLPSIKSGLILTGPYLDDLPMDLVRNSAHRVIGMEIEKTNLFTANQQTVVNSIIVKAVCDFGDGMNNEMYQPTAALLSADLVDKCLSDPQAHKILKGYIYLAIVKMHFTG